MKTIMLIALRIEKDEESKCMYNTICGKENKILFHSQNPHKPLLMFILDLQQE